MPLPYNPAYKKKTAPDYESFLKSFPEFASKAFGNVNLIKSANMNKSLGETTAKDESSSNKQSQQQEGIFGTKLSKYFDESLQHSKKTITILNDIKELLTKREDPVNTIKKTDGSISDLNNESERTTKQQGGIFGILQNKLFRYFNEDIQRLDKAVDLLGNIKNLLATDEDDSRKNSTPRSKIESIQKEISTSTTKKPTRSGTVSTDKDNDFGKRDFGKILGNFPGFFAQDFSLRFLKNLLGPTLFKATELDKYHSKVKSDYSDILHGREDKRSSRETNRIPVQPSTAAKQAPTSIIKPILGKENDNTIVESISGAHEELDKVLTPEESEKETSRPLIPTPKPYVRMNRAGIAAVEALRSLGIKAKEGKTLVEYVLQDLGPDASEAELIKAALQVRGKPMGNSDSFQKAPTDNTIEGGNITENGITTPTPTDNFSDVKVPTTENKKAPTDNTIEGGNITENGITTPTPTDNFSDVKVPTTENKKAPTDNTIEGGNITENGITTPTPTDNFSDVKVPTTENKKETEGFSGTAFDELQQKMKSAFASSIKGAVEDEEEKEQEKPANIKKNPENIFSSMLDERENSPGETISNFLNETKNVMKQEPPGGINHPEGEIEGFSSAALDELQKRMKAAFVDAIHETEEEDEGNEEETDLRKATDSGGKGTVNTTIGKGSDSSADTGDIGSAFTGATDIDALNAGKKGPGGDFLGEVLEGIIGGVIARALGPILTSLTSAIGGLVPFLGVAGAAGIGAVSFVNQTNQARQNEFAGAQSKTLGGQFSGEIKAGIHDAAAQNPLMGLGMSLAGGAEHLLGIKDPFAPDKQIVRPPVSKQTSDLVATGDKRNVLTAQANGKKDQPPVVISSPNNSQNNRTNISQNTILNDTARDIFKGALWIAQYG